MVATKIFKKCSPHGRLYLYLGQREFISSDGLIDDIKGIAHVPEQRELQGELLVCFSGRLYIKESGYPIFQGFSLTSQGWRW